MWIRNPGIDGSGSGFSWPVITTEFGKEVLGSINFKAYSSGCSWALVPPYVGFSLGLPNDLQL